MSGVPDEYIEMENKLAPFAQEHELDAVTLRSLIGSSVRIIEPDMEPANIVVFNKNRSGAKRVSLKTIRIDIKYAINLIYQVKTLITSKKIWFILALLKLILQLAEDVCSNLDYQEAVVLFCCYRLGEADQGRIERYVNQLKAENEIEDIEINVAEALENLENYKIIEMISGLYRLCEYILIR